MAVLVLIPYLAPLLLPVAVAAAVLATLLPEMVWQEDRAAVVRKLGLVLLVIPQA